MDSVQLFDFWRLKKVQFPLPFSEESGGLFRLVPNLAIRSADSSCMQKINQSMSMVVSASTPQLCRCQKHTTTLSPTKQHQHPTTGRWAVQHRPATGFWIEPTCATRRSLLLVEPGTAYWEQNMSQIISKVCHISTPQSRIVSSWNHHLPQAPPHSSFGSHLMHHSLPNSHATNLHATKPIKTA